MWKLYEFNKILLEHSHARSLHMSMVVPHFAGTKCFECLWQRPYGPQSPEYLLSLQKSLSTPALDCKFQEVGAQSHAALYPQSFA